MTPAFSAVMDVSGPQGHILIEVDDLATHENAVHAEKHGKAPEDRQVWQMEEHLQQ